VLFTVLLTRVAVGWALSIVPTCPYMPYITHPSVRPPHNEATAHETCKYVIRTDRTLASATQTVVQPNMLDVHPHGKSNRAHIEYTQVRIYQLTFQTVIDHGGCRSRIVNDGAIHWLMQSRRRIPLKPNSISEVFLNHNLRSLACNSQFGDAVCKARKTFSWASLKQTVEFSAERSRLSRLSIQAYLFRLRWLSWAFSSSAGSRTHSLRRIATYCPNLSRRLVMW